MRNAHFQPASSEEAKMNQVDMPCGAEKVGAGALATSRALGSPSPWTVGYKPLQLSTGRVQPSHCTPVSAGPSCGPRSRHSGSVTAPSQMPTAHRGQSGRGTLCSEEGSAPEHASVDGPGDRVCRGPRGRRARGQCPESLLVVWPWPIMETLPAAWL